MRYSSGARFSRAKPTGSFRVLQPSTRSVASHDETLKDARKSAAYWTRAVSSSMEIQERFPSGAWVTVETVTPASLRTGSGRSKRRAHATMKEGGQLAKSETRLPGAGAKETKKNVAVMKAFNSKVEKLLDQAGASLHHELAPDHRQFVLETKAGPLFVTPLGNWVATRFEDPEAAAKLVGTYNLNTYSGKWNHNYFDRPINEALRDVANWLKRIAA